MADLLRKEDVSYIVIHCSDSSNDMEFTAEDIHQWHRDRSWEGIGYHRVIERSGRIRHGRPLYWRGAHVKGYNHMSVGVCLIGRDEFTAEQWAALFRVVNKLTHIFPGAKVVGHRDMPGTHKTCPNFDVEVWWHKAS